MAKRYEITAEELKDLYYGKNMSLDMIAKIKQVSCSCISAAMIRNNIPRRSDGDGLRFAWEQGRHRVLKCKLDATQLDDLYNRQSMSSCQIAETLGVHSTTILGRLQNFGISRRTPKENQQLAVSSGRRKPWSKLALSHDELHDLYWNKNKTAKEIGKLYGTSENPVYRKMKLLGIPTRTTVDALKIGRQNGKYVHRVGNLAPTWKGGRTIDGSGYVLVKLQHTDKYFAMCCKRGYVREHRLIIAKILGRPLEKWEQPHHRDGNKLNNDPSNLELRIGNHGKGASLKSYEEELLKRLAELYSENEALKKSIQPDQTAGNIIGEIVANGKEIQSNNS